MRLARMDLEAGRIDAAEALAGQVLGEAKSNDLLHPEVESLELLAEAAQARFAYLSGDGAAAVALMEAARERAGQAWDETSEEAYRRYVSVP